MSKVISIVDNGNSVLFTKDDGTEYNLIKADHDVVGNPSKSQYIIQRDSDNVLIFRFTDITTPSEANFGALLDFIQALFNVAATATVSEKDGTVAATTSVAANTSSVLLLAANSSRISATIRNDGTKVLFVKKGSGATTDQPIKLEQDDELFFDDYTGIVHGIWNIANGFARIEETT